MNKTSQAFVAPLVALLLGTLAIGAHAADRLPDNRIYIGGAVGGSSYSLPSSRVPVTVPWGGEKNSKGGTAYKLYGGWRFTENFGVEAGYARLGRVRQWSSVGAYPTLQSGTGQVFYGAATTRLPLSDAFALNGRLGIAHGRISGGGSSNRLLPAGQDISGNGTGLMAGFGAEYRFTNNLAMTADYDYFGKVSKHAKGGMLTVGLRASF